MKKITLSILTLSIMIGFTACKTEETENTIATKKIRTLGVDLEWQTELSEGKNWQDAQDYCLNQGMRLPSPEEFFALLDTNQSIDTLFPSTIKEFWTSADFNDTKAWKITTWSSTQSYADKNSTLGVRCVTGERLPTHSFHNQVDTFEDKNLQNNTTKLWQDIPENSTNRLTFAQATNYCQAKNMRLPTLFELQQTLKANPQYLKTGDFLAYWSTTPLPTDADSRMTVNFTTGAVLFSDVAENNHLRCVKVLDTTAPVITLEGNSTITLAQFTPFTDLGATAVDDMDGLVEVVVSGTVNSAIVGTYTLTYTAMDKAGNQATRTREVTIVDTTLPELSLHGAALLTLRQNETYIEEGASAYDAVDGALTVTISGDVDTSKPGDYILTYTTKDKAGNQVNTTRLIRVLDTTAPTITLSGQTNITINQHQPYSDAGASAYDSEEGEIVVRTTGSVNSDVAGIYTITYSATDSAGNQATPVTRTITVLDTELPVITLTGSNPQIIYKGDNYSELGATALDNVGISGTILIDTKLVDTNTIGEYIVTYTATDTSGNRATKTRVVQVVDNTKPIITLLGENPQSIEVGTAYTELGATALDDVDGDISAAIMIDSSALNINRLGTYTILYNVKDSNNNSALTAQRSVKVVDTTAPTIQLNGSATITIDENSTYTDAGVSVNDNYDNNVTLTIENDLNTSQVGSYTITYTAIDSSGNRATLSRNVLVRDITKPTITLGGDNPLHLSVNTPYQEPGASAMDAVDGNLDVTIIGEINNTKTGIYTRTYSATDSANNTAYVTREIIVEDKQRPVITLNGDAIINIEVGSNYSDAGAQVIDNYDSALEANVSGHVDTNSLGSYILTYSAIDSSGNEAMDISRTINVVDTTPPTLTLIGQDNITLSLGESYIDAGATATDNYAVDNAAIVIVNPVDTNISGSYTVTYNVKDSQGNAATELTRTVIVKDSTTQVSSSYRPHLLTSNATESEWLEMVDIDQDGDLDILSASIGNGGKEIAWYENHGDNSFTEHLISADVNQAKSIKAADIDNDGDLDILFSTLDGSGASLKLCLNDGSQTFDTCTNIPNTIGALSYIDIVDIDNDGYQDIVSASWDNNRLDWYKNDANGGFSSPILIDNANMTEAISIDHADFDKDGDIDIIAASYGENRIDWYENDGTGAFTPHFIDDTIQGVYAVKVSDISNNGILDIITTSNSDGKVYWHATSETTAPNFTAPSLVASLDNVYYAVGVDMDGDGDMDILSNSSTLAGKIAWYENIGSSTDFTEHIVASNVDNVIRVFAADMDNDGHMDIISGDSAGHITLYENSGEDIVTLLPKTGDSSDGDFGGTYSFTRDNTNEIVTDTLTKLSWQDNDDVSKNAKKWADIDIQNDCRITLGGFTDWRFPNRHELYYLAQKNSTILDAVFNYNGSIFLKDYWTSSPHEIYVSFSKAISKVALSINYTRCVRGDAIVFNFIRDDNSNVVLDKKHALMWEDTSDSLIREASSWDEAKSACEVLDYLGYSDWRLPNIHELYSLFDEEGWQKAFKYKNDQGSLISSTTYNASTDEAYGIDVSSGLDTQTSKDSTLSYRCVRSIQ